MPKKFIVLNAEERELFVDPDKILYMYINRDRGGKTVVVLADELKLYVLQTPKEIIELINGPENKSTGEYHLA